MGLAALVINPDLNSRLRFRDITKAVTNFGHVQMSATLQEGLVRLREDREYDVLYISHRFDRPVCKQFIVDAKGTKFGQDSAYLLTVTSEVTQTDIAQLVADGMDGFLMEPFSTQGLVDSTDLAQHVKKQKKLVREKAVLRMLIQEAAKLVDKSALNRSMNVPDLLTQKKLAEIKDAIQGFSEEARQEYYPMLIDIFERAAPVQVPKEGYRGASSRMRRRVISKIVPG